MRVFVPMHLGFAGKKEESYSYLQKLRLDNTRSGG
jgi:hypothetical protein